jgi:hypothetical protein
MQRHQPERMMTSDRTLSLTKILTFSHLHEEWYSHTYTLKLILLIRRASILTLKREDTYSHTYIPPSHTYVQ